MDKVDKKWTTHIRGADLEFDDETKARNIRKFSRSITQPRFGSRISEEARSGLGVFLRATYPSLSTMHSRVIMQKMLEFLQVFAAEQKKEQVFAEIQQGNALFACTYFLDWVSGRSDDCYELRCAVLALEQAMKKTRHHV